MAKRKVQQVIPETYNRLFQKSTTGYSRKVQQVIPEKYNRLFQKLKCKYFDRCTEYKIFPAM